MATSAYAGTNDPAPRGLLDLPAPLVSDFFLVRASLLAWGLTHSSLHMGSHPHVLRVKNCVKKKVVFENGRSGSGGRKLDRPAGVKVAFRLLGGIPSRASPTGARSRASPLARRSPTRPHVSAKPLVVVKNLGCRGRIHQNFFTLIFSEKWGS